MMPDVPMVGWDVAFTDKGVCMLEVRRDGHHPGLPCNEQMLNAPVRAP